MSFSIILFRSKPAILLTAISSSLSFSFARPKENETKEKGATGKATFARVPHCPPSLKLQWTKPALRKMS